MGGLEKAYTNDESILIVNCHIGGLEKQGSSSCLLVNRHMGGLKKPFPLRRQRAHVNRHMRGLERVGNLIFGFDIVNRQMGGLEMRFASICNSQ